MQSTEVPKNLSVVFSYKNNFLFYLCTFSKIFVSDTMRICGLHNRTVTAGAGGSASAIESFLQPQLRKQFADEVKQKQVSVHLPHVYL